MKKEEKKKWVLKEKLNYKFEFLLTETFKGFCKEFMYNNLFILSNEQKDFIVRLQSKEYISKNELNFLKSFIPVNEKLYENVKFIDRKNREERWVKVKVIKNKKRSYGKR
jgi:hypothetical protein